MRIIKNAVVIASLLGLVTALGACVRERHEPMKLGAVNAPVQQVIPG